MTRRVCLVTVATDTAFIDWGLELNRVVPHLVVYCAPAVVTALQGRVLPSHVLVVALGADECDDTDVTLGQRLRWLNRARQSGAFEATAWFWIDLPLCHLHLSLHYLYTDLLVETLETLTGPTCFLVPGYRHWSLFGGPGDLMAELLTTDEDLAASLFDHASSEPADPGQLRRYGDPHPVDEPNLYLSEARTQAAVHVIGDSHIFTCFTRPEELACRANILSANPERAAGSRVPPLLFSHHAGSVTMHRAGRPGMLHTYARDYRVRDGDTVVWVFGEVDVRCHIVRQQEFVGRDVGEVVDTLVAKFVANMVALRQDYPNLTQAVFAPIPPLDNSTYVSDQFPIHGSIDQRIACRALLVAQLESACRRHQFLFLDIGPQFATPRGDLEWAKSDQFCHLGHGYQAGILAQLFDLLDRADPFR